MKTNDFLIGVAVFAVVIATANLLITVNKVEDMKYLTGLVTDTGWANLTVQANVAINFTNENVSWGTGNVPEGQTSCELDTQGNSNCSNFDIVSQGLLLENIGNVNVVLNLSASKGADDFIGGTNPVFQWNVSESEAGSCTPQTNITSWTDVANNTGGTRACENFSFNDNNDVLEIDLRIVLPNDAPQESKGVTITADAEQLT